MSPPPRALIAAETRRLVETHDEWDFPHAFVTLHWDGQKLTYGTYVSIMPDVPPGKYAALMIRTAREWLRSHPENPPYAYLLQIEEFEVLAPGPDAPEAERARFQADRIGYAFHKRPDRIEQCTAICADIHGRLWTASKTRDREDTIREAFYPPDSGKLGGRFTSGLLAVAYATGTIAWELPVHPRAATWN